MAIETEKTRVKRRGAWTGGDGRWDPPFEYRYIRVKGPVVVAWCASHECWFDPGEAAIGLPCPARREGECNSVLVKRVGHLCLECVEEPLIRRGGLRAHISAYHGQ